jgi:hypothetical protein
MSVGCQLDETVGHAKGLVALTAFRLNCPAKKTKTAADPLWILPSFSLHTTDSIMSSKGNLKKRKKREQREQMEALGKEKAKQLRDKKAGSRAGVGTADSSSGNSSESEVEAAQRSSSSVGRKAKGKQKKVIAEDTSGEEEETEEEEAGGVSGGAGGGVGGGEVLEETAEVGAAENQPDISSPIPRKPLPPSSRENPEVRVSPYTWAGSCV